MPKAFRVPTQAEVDAYDIEALRRNVAKHQENIQVFQEKIMEEQAAIQFLSSIIQKKMEQEGNAS